MSQLILAVSGSRDFPYASRSHINRVLSLYEGNGRTLLIHGCCRGLDQIAASLGAWRGFEVKPFPAEDYGSWPACGPKRNAAMAEFCKGMMMVGHVVHAHAWPASDSKGTPNFVDAFGRIGVKADEHTEWATAEARAR